MSRAQVFARGETVPVGRGNAGGAPVRAGRVRAARRSDGSCDVVPDRFDAVVISITSAPDGFQLVHAPHGLTPCRSRTGRLSPLSIPASRADGSWFAEVLRRLLLRVDALPAQIPHVTNVTQSKSLDPSLARNLDTSSREKGSRCRQKRIVGRCRGDRAV